MEFRVADRSELAAVLALIADDDLTRRRGYGEVPETPDAAIVAAFDAIADDPRNEVIVAVDGDEVVGTCQLTYIPGLTRGGGERMQIEGVRIASGRRGQGLGGEMIRWAIDRARDRGCTLVQLTTDKQRVDAQRFYRDLGFESSHEGMKLEL